MLNKKNILIIFTTIFTKVINIIAAMQYYFLNFVIFLYLLAYKTYLILFDVYKNCYLTIYDI